MDKTQEEIYLFLFRAWKHEVSSNKIGKIKDKDIFLKDMQFLINKIKESIEKSDKKEKVIKRIHEKTLENILYMIKDFFDIRSEKILNLSRSLQIIDEETLFPVERDYYKQLFLAFKGDSKTKKYLLASIENNHNIPDIKIDEKENSQEINTPINSNSIPILEPDEISTNMESKIAEKNQILKKNQDEEYILIRFTKNIPALVGKDLKVYGPFQKEDMAQLPIQNASILIEENAAIKINPES
ncbi:MAG: DNA replication complex subunit Gins51 [Promethearchaeota archaeon]